MRTRTWLTTPVDQSPDTDGRTVDGERYVPGPDLPSEPRIPVRHRGLMVLITALVIGIVVLGVLVIRGEEAQQQDPSLRESEQDEQPLELPES